MKDLIERLKKATGPSRSLDAMIKYEVGHDQSPYEIEGLTLAYTSSIDAALTLVPEGLKYSMGLNDSFYWAWVGRDGEENAAQTGENQAIALTIASLKARMGPD